MKKYEVGYPDQMIGVYPGDTPEQAIAACKEEMSAAAFKPVRSAMSAPRALFALDVTETQGRNAGQAQGGRTISQLRQFIADNPEHVSGDDDIVTDDGVRATAELVRDRMSEDQPGPDAGTSFAPG